MTPLRVQLKRHRSIMTTEPSGARSASKVPLMKHTSVCYSLFSFIWPDTPSQEEKKVSNIQIMLYTVGALSIIAFVWVRRGLSGGDKEKPAQPKPSGFQVQVARTGALGCPPLALLAAYGAV